MGRRFNLGKGPVPERWPDMDIESMTVVKLNARNGDRLFLEDQVMARTTFVRKGRGGPEQRMRYRREIREIKEIIDGKNDR